MARYRRTLGLFALLLLATGNLYSVVPPTVDARRATRAIFTEPDVREQFVERQVVSQRDRSLVLLRSEQQRGYRYYIYSPTDGENVDLVQPGTWIMRRRIDDGAFDQIKIFLQHDEGSFVRISPDGRRVQLELYLAGAPIYTGVPLSMSFQRVFDMSFAEIVAATDRRVDWHLLEVVADDPGYAAVAAMVARARRALPTLPDAPDGAMDEHGNMVAIETITMQEELPGFNCSGFAKWIIDGLYVARTGRYLAIDPLKEKHLDRRGTSWSAPREEDRDPYFGLDWTRNLARSMDAAIRGADPLSLDPEGYDVRDVPLSAYREDVGFPVDELRSVLYWLAWNDPGAFYLGSVNRSFGEELMLRQHTHVVVLFPWFDDMGTFRVSVMERNVETSVASLERRYGNDFLHLVRVEADTSFVPPVIVDRRVSTRSGEN